MRHLEDRASVLRQRRDEYQSNKVISHKHTSAVGVNDILRLDRIDGVLGDLLGVTNGDDGRQVTLRDHDDTIALGVHLGQVGKALCDLCDVFRLHRMQHT